MSEAPSSRELPVTDAGRPSPLTRLVSLARRRPQLTAHLALSTLYVLSRYLMDLAGIRLNLILDWMFISDPADLRDRLLPTLYYAHGFPPGMNLLTGLLLKLDQPQVVANAHTLMQVLGLVAVNSLLYLGRALGLSRAGAFALAAAFALSPQMIYFEHLWIYEIPVVGLLCLAAVLFHRGLDGRSFGAWLGCFAACAAIGWIRSSFHLAWFLVMLGLALWSTGRSQWRSVLLAAAAPAAALLALYLKNLLVFGTFGALTWGSGSLATATIRNMPAEQKQAWVAEGQLSPYAAFSIYAGPRAFVNLFPSSEDPRWPPMLNVLERPTNGAPNFNHWFFLDINRRRRDDAMVYLKRRPLEYARTVALNAVEFFSPSTEWHPRDGAPDAPHHRHRQVLGAWERAFKQLVYTWPIAPVGLYLLFPVVLWPAISGTWSIRRRSVAQRDPRACLLAFCLIQIGYVTTTGVLFAFGEAPRYRFQIDPFIWLMAALSLSRLLAWVRQRKR